VGRAEAQEFDQAYRTLRLLEHRIQLSAMVRSHVMPQGVEELRILARQTTLADTAEALVAQWRHTQRLVRSPTSVSFIDHCCPPLQVWMIRVWS
jgi:glutamate-ammonia-ligase adenylyltransferase